MTDVEWSVQITTLDRAHDHPALLTTSTMDALRAAGEAELIPQRSACELREAWTLAWQIRRSLFLWKGREGEVLPSDRNELRALRSEEHTSELQSRGHLVCRLLLEKKNTQTNTGAT